MSYPNKEWLYLSPKERLNKRTKKDPKTGCWNWTGSKLHSGYGRMSFNSKPTVVHRISWEINFGQIPKGLFVCHKCDNKLCINPTHLFLGTCNDNVQDMIKKGRMAIGSQRNHSHLTEELVTELKRLNREQGITGYKLGSMFGISRANAYYILNGHIWGHIN